MSGQLTGAAGIAAAHTQKIGDSARLLALGTIAIADAVIACWDSKLALQERTAENLL